jgi:hypothetical protein
MTKLKALSNNIIEVIKSYVPEQLPQTESAVIAFATSVCKIAKLPVNDSFIHAIASQIMHLDMRTTKVNKRMFINALRRSIANQASYNIISVLKDKQAKDKANDQERAESTPV